MLILLIIILLAIILGGSVLFSNFNFKKGTSKLSTNPPSLFGEEMQVFYDWDITSERSHFEVLNVLPEKKSMELKFIFPLKYRDVVVTSKITCALDDSIVVYTKRNRETTAPPVSMSDQNQTESTITNEADQGLGSQTEEGTTNQKVSGIAKKPLYLIAEKGSVLRGICADQNCSKISKSCVIYIPHEN